MSEFPSSLVSKMSRLTIIPYFTAVADAIRTSLGPKGMDKMVSVEEACHCSCYSSVHFSVHLLIILSIHPHCVRIKGTV